MSEVDKRSAGPGEKRARAAEERSELNRRFLSCALCGARWWRGHEDLDASSTAYHLRNRYGLALNPQSACLTVPTSHDVVGHDSRELEEKYMYMHPDGEVETPAVWIP